MGGGVTPAAQLVAAALGDSRLSQPTTCFCSLAACSDGWHGASEAAGSPPDRTSCLLGVPLLPDGGPSLGALLLGVPGPSEAAQALQLGTQLAEELSRHHWAALRRLTDTVEAILFRRTPPDTGEGPEELEEEEFSSGLQGMWAAGPLWGLDPGLLACCWDQPVMREVTMRPGRGNKIGWGTRPANGHSHPSHHCCPPAPTPSPRIPGEQRVTPGAGPPFPPVAATAALKRRAPTPKTAQTPKGRTGRGTGTSGGSSGSSAPWRRAAATVPPSSRGSGAGRPGCCKCWPSLDSGSRIQDWRPGFKAGMHTAWSG